MLNFFDTLIEYVQIVFQFFLNLINSLIHAVAVMTSSASLITPSDKIIDHNNR